MAGYWADAFSVLRTSVNPMMRSPLVLHASNCLDVISDNGTIATNPTSTWKGASHSNSPHVQHVTIHQEAVNTIEIIQQTLDAKAENNKFNLNASELLELGCVWYLPVNATRNPSLGQKPTRLSPSGTNPRHTQLPTSLIKGDYLRIHTEPRRYLEVHWYDWNIDTSPLIVAKGTGWLVLNKPPNVPVHATVDNCRENVVDCLLAANSPPKLVYVATPQRLDHNTSGLMVVATSKPFAAYFAKLLQYKTKTALVEYNSNKTNIHNDEINNTTEGAIHKRYRCLVQRANDENATTTTNPPFEHNQLLEHYLEPSLSAPKRFVKTPPADSDWPACLLRILSVEPSNNDNDHTQQWELEIELLTGRTHQIRGQLAAEGFPLVGDAMYQQLAAQQQQQLALQCHSLQFVDPDWSLNDDGEPSWRLSHRWQRFRLDVPHWRTESSPKEN